MEIPFVYGKIVSDNDFTDREEETRKLVSNFLSQTNTVGKQGDRISLEIGQYHIVRENECVQM